MQVILKQDIPKIGKKHDILNVKAGFYRNFLYPRGLAMQTTEKRLELARVEQEKRILQRKEIEAKAEEMAKKLDGVVVILQKKATKKGKLYGSITKQAIMEVLENDHRVHIEKDQIMLADNIKEIGEYKTELKLTDTVSCKITIKIEVQKES